ncbi:MAG TPA: YraN family protein [Vicinamibacterales bacterium]|jgi:putative endonuclease
MPLLDRISLGKSGEDLACRELERRGYAILARRYRTRFGEIDIVARDGPTIVFIEVKARTSDRYGDPAEAVTLHKQAKVTAMAEDYLARRGLFGAPCRFDVVGVIFAPDGKLRLEVIQSAFDAVAWR